MTASTPREDRFSEPAQNDATGHCVHCGRDNSEYPGEPCSDECPGYWEARGIPHPDYPGEPLVSATVTDTCNPSDPVLDESRATEETTR